MLSMPQNEKIVKLLAHGHNTYAELHAALPEVDEDDWTYAARLGGESPDTSPSVFIRDKGPHSFFVPP